ncbi:MAG: hypothetical protein EPN21_17210 [Methylococcaceae bacterium]|nr:MAG: hypothetical protein EPN21_17210 [Methylococcaceae bacterium]
MAAAIELPPRSSQARHWRALSAEICDVLVDAAHHPAVLHGALRPELLVITSPRWLPVDAADPDMLALHRWLKQQGLEHHFGWRRDDAAHSIRVRLLPAAAVQPAPNRFAEALRITLRPLFFTTPQRSATMHADPRTTSATPRQPGKKSWLTALIDWLFGPPDDGPAPAKPRSVSKAEPHFPPPGTELAPQATVEYENNWLETFYDALTKATALFILKWVEPVHKLEPSYYFSVRAVKVAITEAAAPCLEVLEVVPPDVLNLVVKNRLKQAHGNSHLMLDNFFGLIIVADSALLDSRVVQTLVSYSGQRFYLRFQIDGEYVTLPNGNTAVHAQSATPSADPLDWSGDDDFDEEKTLPAFSAGAPDDEEERTALACPAAPREQPAIAKLRIKPFAGQESVVYIRQQQLPFTIGRSQLQEHGVNVAADAANPETIKAVSRRHLILESFDPVGRHFCIHNQGAGSNGTYCQGRAMPERFMQRLTTDHWLSLGGSDGAGTVRIALESP